MELNINFNKNNVTITFSIELGDYYKSIIEPNQKFLRRCAQDMSSTVKKSKYFESFTMGYSQNDYYSDYDEYCDYEDDSYEVPYAYCDSNNRRIKIKYDNYTEVPKTWSKYASITLTQLKDMRLFNKIINELNNYTIYKKYKLNDKQINQIRESIKLQKNIIIIN